MDLMKQLVKKFTLEKNNFPKLQVNQKMKYLNHQ